MLQKVAFTMYPVLDINRAKSFYEKNLGLTPSKITANGSWVEYDLAGGGCFVITTLAEGVKPSSSSGGSIAFEVSDLDELVKQLKNNGVEFKLDVFSSPVCRMAVIVDSEGNAITLHQLKNNSWLLNHTGNFSANEQIHVRYQSVIRKLKIFDKEEIAPAFIQADIDPIQIEPIRVDEEMADNIRDRLSKAEMMTMSKLALELSI